MIAAVIALSVIAVSTDDPLTYRVFPAFIWAALRFSAFAGFLSHTDHHIGRLMDFLRETGELENTIVMCW